jgi:hypothetical protein
MIIDNNNRSYLTGITVLGFCLFSLYMMISGVIDLNVDEHMLILSSVTAAVSVSLIYLHTVCIAFISHYHCTAIVLSSLACCS